jgi:hypothetical protein
MWRPDVPSERVWLTVYGCGLRQQISGLGAIKPTCRSVPRRAAQGGRNIAANNGVTARQLMAIFGWDTIKQAEHYTRKADQRQLAEAAMHLLEKR